MRKLIALVVTLLFLTTAPILVDPAGAKKKVRVKPYKAQATFTFNNHENKSVHGLHVVLNGQATALTDPQTGFVGPFRDIRGNGTQRLKLRNPATPISANHGSGDEITVTFRSNKRKLRINKWWWTDHKGKPVGSKKSGKGM